MKETVGFNPGGRPTEKTGIPENPVSEPTPPPPTLKDAGIDLPPTLTSGLDLLHRAA
jgi:hypothetical protein